MAPTMKIRVDATQGKRETGRFQAAVRGLGGYVDRARSSLQRMGSQSDRTGRKLANTKRNVDGASRSMRAMNSIGKQLAVTLFSVTALLGSVGVFANFEQSMADLSAITGATGQQLLFLEGAARRMGSSSKFSAGEAAQAFKLVASAKPDLLSSEVALAGVTEQVLLLAAASGEDLTRAADIVGSSLNQFAADADQANRFVNVLAAGSKFGASAVSATGDALKNAGVVAKSAGLSFEQTVASIQILAASGIKAAEAGTAMKTVLSRLEKQTDERFKPSVVGLEQALKNVAAEGWSTAEIFEFFGQYGATAALALTKNTGALTEMNKKLTDTDVAGEQAAIQMDTLLGDWKNMKSALEELQIALVGAFGQDMRNGIQASTSTILNVAKASLHLGVVWINVKNTIQQLFFKIIAFGGEVVAALRYMVGEVGRIIAQGFANALDNVAKAIKGVVFLLEKMGRGSGKTAQLLRAAGDSLQTYADGRAEFGRHWSEAFTEGAAGADEFVASIKSAAKALEGENAEAAAEMTLRMEFLKDAIHGAKVAVEDVRGELEELDSQDSEEVIDAITASMKDLHKSLLEQVAAARLQNEHFGKGKTVIEAYVAISKLGGDATSEWGKKILAAAADVDSFIARLEKKNQVLEGNRAVIEEIRRLNELKETYGLSEDALARYNLQKTLALTSDIRLRFALIASNEAFLAHKKAVDQSAASMEYWRAVNEELTREFGDFLFDFIKNGEDAIEEFGEYIKDTLIQAVTDAVAKMVVSGILNIVVGGQGGQGQQGATNGAVSGILGNFLERTPRGERGTGVAGSGYSGRQVGQAGVAGLGIGLAASEAYGYGTTESQLTGTLGGAAAGASYGGWVGAIVGAIAGGLTSGLFTGTDWESVGYELGISIEDGLIAGYQQIDVLQRDKPFLGGTERRSTVANVHDLQLQDAVTAGLESGRDTVLEQARLLGVGTAQEVIDGYQRTFTIDLTGATSQEEINSRLAAAFRESQNSMVNMVLPQVAAFQQVGEDLARTFERLSGAADVVDTQFIGMGFDPDSFINEASIAQTLQSMEDWRERLFQGYIEPLLTPEFPDVESVLNEPSMQEIQRQIEELYQDAVDFADIEATLIEMAIIDFKDRMAQAVGGNDELRDIFARYTRAFQDTNAFLDRSVVQAVEDAEATAQAALAAAGTTRETFVADLDAAMNSNLFSPEELAMLYAAGAALSDLMVAEQTLADHRGEAYRVESLTVDQLALIADEARDLNIVLGELQTGLVLTEQNILDLSAVFGSAADFSSEYTQFMRAMLGETEFARLQFEAAQGVIADFGYTLEEVAAMGREGVVDLVNAAIAAGDFEKAAELMRVFGVAVDTYLEGIGQGAEGVGDAAEGATDSLAETEVALLEVVEASRALGDGLLLTEGAAAMLVETMGGVEAAVSRVNFVNRNFLSDSERLAVELGAASTAIIDAGYTVEEFATGGKEHFLNLLRAASALGDDATVASLYAIAPAVLTVIEANAQRVESENEVADATEEATAATRSYALEIDAAVTKIKDSIARIRSVANEALGGRGTAHSSASIRASIADGNGRRGIGTIGQQIENIESLTSLHVSLFELQVSQIEEIQRLENEAHQQEIDRRRALYEESLRNYEEELAQAKALRGLALSIRDFISGLEQGSLTPLAPLDALAAAQAELSQLIAQGIAGDAGAAGDAQGQAQTVLQLAQSLYGGTLPYVEIFNQVVGQLDTLAAALAATPDPVKPPEQHFEDISQNTGLTAERVAQVSQLESAALAELNELRDELEELREQEAEEAEEKKEREIENNTALKSADESLLELKDVATGQLDRAEAMANAIDALLYEVERSGQAERDSAQRIEQAFYDLPGSLALAVQSSFDNSAAQIVTAVNAVQYEVAGVRAEMRRGNEIAEDQIEATQAQNQLIEENNALLEDQTVVIEDQGDQPEGSE